MIVLHCISGAYWRVSSYLALLGITFQPGLVFRLLFKGVFPARVFLMLP